MIVNIFDYKVGNLKSVYNFFSWSLGLKTNVIENLNKSNNFDILVLPGVGSFGSAIGNINQKNRELIYDFAKNKKKNIIGICLGMQILSEESSESSGYSGLGLIEGKFKKIQETNNFKIPNVGWHSIIPVKKNNILSNLKNKCYYFDHSYYLNNNKNTIGYINYKNKIPSIIKKKNIIGFQFHPEKSQQAGLQLIKNYLLTI
jgi:imidazole glycerol-phosphate synthase subunit HisH